MSVVVGGKAFVNIDEARKFAMHLQEQNEKKESCKQCANCKCGNAVSNSTNSMETKDEKSI